MPPNPFKIDLKKNKDETILLNPLEIVKGLILNCDSQPRISSTTEIIKAVFNTPSLSGIVVFLIRDCLALAGLLLHVDAAFSTHNFI